MTVWTNGKILLNYTMKQSATHIYEWACCFYFNFFLKLPALIAICLFPSWQAMLIHILNDAFNGAIFLNIHIMQWLLCYTCSPWKIVLFYFWKSVYIRFIAELFGGWYTPEDDVVIVHWTIKNIAYIKYVMWCFEGVEIK